MAGVSIVFSGTPIRNADLLIGVFGYSADRQISVVSLSANREIGVPGSAPR